MKIILFILVMFVAITLSAQNNTTKGFAVNGYDVVAYFSNTATKGNKKITAKHEGATYKFSSEENKALFVANPEKYLPQYGGWCAYAMGVNGEKVSINPKTFEIRGAKLYLFYNKLGTNTLDSWLKEKPEVLIPMADANWAK